MKNPLISIGMPVYNAAPYLVEAIEGILSQSYANIELVITDNCSSDSSGEIASEYAAHYPERVHFIQNRWNVGYSGNAHKATSYCKGDFILMHGADDVLAKDALELYAAQISVNDQPEKLVLMSDFEHGNSQGKSLARWTLDLERYDLTERSLDYKPTEKVVYLHGHEVLKMCFPDLRSFGGVGSVLVARSLYEQVEGYLSNHWFNPDKFFIYKVLSYNPQVIWLREPLYFYRIHESNQLALQKGTSVLRHLLDEYAYTFEFSPDFYNNFGDREALIKQFVETDCLNSALRELAIGNPTLGFRHLAFALATYPEVACHDIKTYLALLGWISGPLGRPILKVLYQRKKANTSDR